jgi:predicted deacylase
MMFALCFLILCLLAFCFFFNVNEHFSDTFINSINRNTLPDFRKVLKTFGVKEEGDVNCDNLDVHTFNGKRKGFRLLIVGSVHGNEPAGTVACYKLIEMLSNRTLKSGTVTIIPTVNPCGVLQYTRTSNGIDLNRTYETSVVTPQQNRTVMKYVNNSDVVIDCHEGHGYYLLNGTLKQLNKSMGSTLTAGRGVIGYNGYNGYNGYKGYKGSIHISSVKLAENAINYINSTLNLSDHYKFSLYPDNTLKGTLREYCNSRNVPYVLIETSGQNEIQPINVRRDQQLLVFDSVMRDLGI